MLNLGFGQFSVTRAFFDLIYGKKVKQAERQVQPLRLPDGEAD
jgi:hypothetical protein